MATTMHNGVLFDQYGFITDPYLWSEELAEQLAREDGLGELGPEHWEIITYLRGEYLSTGGPPPVGDACRLMHLEPHCLDHLFRNSREAWRIAGLPDPGEEARTYM
jgi:TusE/DsrC/DsvC family sulfur relay protein